MPVIALEAVEENLRFLILEVRKQVAKTRSYLKNPSDKLIHSVFSKDDYIDNLKDIIQRKCFALAAEVPNDTARIDLLKAVDQVAINLERIADFCENILDQVGYVHDLALLEDRPFASFLDKIVEAIELIEQAVFQRDVKLALRICRAEYELDRLYSKAFQDTLRELETRENIQSLVTIIFIYRYLERMGDALQNIGEAIISASLGERIKIGRFWALEDSLDALDVDESIVDVGLEPMGETRSGCKISRVQPREIPERGRSLIFKEGRRDKVVAERDSIERWDSVMPGLAPKIYAFHDQDDHASLLFEYLAGHTFEELVLHGTANEVDRALSLICTTVAEVWTATREERATGARFGSQLFSRLPDVYEVHPEFRQPARAIGGLESPAFDDLVDRARDLDDQLQAPFSVFIHGDFNLDNVIYDERANRIHFIDLHRSRPMDYLQDVSVFMVSNSRLQVFEAPVRSRINSVVRRFYDFSKEFARTQGDETFDARLALGLARSYATSTRFVLDREFSKSMFMRARYLLERLLAAPSVSEFRIAEEVLVD